MHSWPAMKSKQQPTRIFTVVAPLCAALEIRDTGFSNFSWAKRMRRTAADSHNT